MENCLQTLEAWFNEVEGALECCRKDLENAERKIRACNRIIKNVVKHMKQDIRILNELNDAEENAISAMEEEELAGKGNDLGFIE